MDENPYEAPRTELERRPSRVVGRLRRITTGGWVYIALGAVLAVSAGAFAIAAVTEDQNFTTVREQRIAPMMSFFPVVFGGLAVLLTLHGVNRSRELLVQNSRARILRHLWLGIAILVLHILFAGIGYMIYLNVVE